MFYLALGSKEYSGNGARRGRIPKEVGQIGEAFCSSVQLSEKTREDYNARMQAVKDMKQRQDMYTAAPLNARTYHLDSAQQGRVYRCRDVTPNSASVFHLCPSTP